MVKRRIAKKKRRSKKNVSVLYTSAVSRAIILKPISGNKKVKPGPRKRTKSVSGKANYLARWGALNDLPFEVRTVLD